jgi:hypothetical protein
MVLVNGRRVHMTPEEGVSMYKDMTSGESTAQMYREYTDFDFELIESSATESTCNLRF